MTDTPKHAMAMTDDEYATAVAAVTGIPAIARVKRANARSEGGVVPATGREPLLREVVSIIGGTPTADVFKFLREKSRFITTMQDGRARTPRAASLRKRLAEIESLARRLAELLNEDMSYGDGWLASYLHGAKAPFGAWPQEFTEYLADISERAKIAHARIPSTGGRALPSPMRSGVSTSESALPSPEVFCALLVSEVWQHARGYPPRANDQAAGLACSALWRAIGGQASEDDERWPRHLGAAAKVKAEARVQAVEWVEGVPNQVKPVASTDTINVLRCLWRMELTSDLQNHPK